MDFGLTDEHHAIVDSVRTFVERELYPFEDEVERLDEVPADLANAIRAKAISAGIYAANMPADIGGGGLDAVGLALVERELGRASYALQMLVARPSNILCACNEEQASKYLLPTVLGERHDCLAMTEPGAGSDVRSMRTRAVHVDGGWVINGTKHFISHADMADFVVLFAVTGTEDSPRGPRNLISAFLVDMGTPGFTLNRGASCVSHRGYHQCELVFDDCHVGDDQLLGQEGRGLELMDQWLGASRLTVAANCVGRAQRVLDKALDWSAAREQFGQTIGKFQGIGFQLADLAVAVEAAELLTLRAAWRFEAGEMTAQDAAMAKLFASETLGRVTDTAIQVFGGTGLMSDAPIERWWRDARVERIWDGTSEIQRLIISRSLLRPREYLA
ncbi:MAG: acyl-CoA dehydrogenase family protein [Actinomycetota bacterium]|nr:acyl-CoA dehydrogenase family protein [Actinomycetota bacterium]